MRKLILTFLLLFAFGINIYAQSNEDAAPTDSAGETVAALTGDSVVKRPNIFRRIINYFDDSNKPKEYKRFDWSIIGGPHYSSDTKFGIGIAAAGFYRHNMSDTVTRPSNVSLYGDISTVGFYLIGIKGNHFFSGEKNRIDYNLHFYHFPRMFWGIGYENGNNMQNRSKFDETHVQAKVNYLHSLVPGLFFGPQLSFSFSHAARMMKPELWVGLPRHTSTYGVGAVVQYDTRDNLTATEKGYLVSLEQNFSPRFLFNKQPFSSTALTMSYFQRAWKGSVIAAQYHTKLCYGDVPWASLATFGGSSTMRGYYDGRFRDKGEMDLTVELRQHVWRRSGLVVWGGLGTVYPKLSKINMHHLLPNFGIGYRWEFKKNTNIRLDYGFGRGENSFIFSINEAF